MSHCIVSLSADQWQRWRSVLADYPDVLIAIDSIEDCEGDLNDAALSLALKARLEPDGSLDWLMHFAKRFRPQICHGAYPKGEDSESKGINLAGEGMEAQVVQGVRHLAAESECPNLLVLPVVLWALGQGLDDFCKGLV